MLCCNQGIGINPLPVKQPPWDGGLGYISTWVTLGRASLKNPPFQLDQLPKTPIFQLDQLPKIPLFQLDQLSKTHLFQLDQA